MGQAEIPQGTRSRMLRIGILLLRGRARTASWRRSGRVGNEMGMHGAVMCWWPTGVGFGGRASRAGKGGDGGSFVLFGGPWGSMRWKFLFLSVQTPKRFPPVRPFYYFYSFRGPRWCFILVAIIIIIILTPLSPSTHPSIHPYSRPSKSFCLAAAVPTKYLALASVLAHSFVCRDPILHPLTSPYSAFSALFPIEQPQRSLFSSSHTLATRRDCPVHFL